MEKDFSLTSKERGALGYLGLVNGISKAFLGIVAMTGLAYPIYKAGFKFENLNNPLGSTSTKWVGYASIICASIVTLSYVLNLYFDLRTIFSSHEEEGIEVIR